MSEIRDTTKGNFKDILIVQFENNEYQKTKSISQATLAMDLVLVGNALTILDD